MKFLTVTLLVMLSTVAFAQLEQLTTLSRSSVANSSDPKQFATLGTGTVFLANGDGTGIEPWITDGTDAGTHIIKDVVPGPVGLDVKLKVVMKGKLYFIAYFPLTGHRLWVTDGTAAGTVQVSNLAFDYIETMTTDGNFLWFFEEHKATADLWKSDGTSAGTMKSMSVNFDRGIRVQNLTAVGSTLFFSATINETGVSPKVWKTDGTPGGTVVVSGTLYGDGTNYAHPSHFVNYNGSLYFLANTGSVGLWKCDPTGIASLVKSMYSPGNTYMDYNDLIIHNGLIYTSAFEQKSLHLQVWESDGIAANTNQIFESQESKWFSPSNLFGQGDHVYFTSGDGSANTNTILNSWNTTTKTIKSLPGNLPSIAAPFSFSPNTDLTRIAGGQTGTFFLNAKSSNAFHVLYSANTKVAPVPQVQAMYDMIYANGKLLFSGSATTVRPFDTELWATKNDDSAALLKQINSTNAGINNDVIAVSGNKGLFSAQLVNTGWEPLITDGTSAGTHVLKDINPKGDSYPEYQAKWGDQFVFYAESDAKHSIYKSDGTDAGTIAVADLPSDKFIDFLFVGGDYAYVILTDFNSSSAMYRMKKDETSLSLVKDFGTNMYGAGMTVYGYAVAGNNIFLLVGGSGTELWKSDGTTAGTSMISQHNNAANLTSVGSSVYFYTSDDDFATNSILQKSDGHTTTAVTGLSGPASSLTAFNSKLLYAVSTPQGRKPWITDGTLDGTVKISDIDLVWETNLLRAFNVVGNTAFFAGNDGTKGAELYKTDGTVANTVLVKDINNGADSSNPSFISVIDDKIYFAAYTPDAGVELWTSDGTGDGTKMLVDIIPGAGYGAPSRMTKVNGRLLFFGLTPGNGQQLLAFGPDPGAVTGLDEESSFVVYPNPSTGLFTLTSPVESFQLYSSDGKLAYSGTGQHIDLRHSPNGIYFVRFFNNGRSHTLKVVKN